MEITKDKLETKRNEFIEQHKVLSIEIGDKTLLKYKLEGAIESINILLKELENEIKP